MKPIYYLASLFFLAIACTHELDMQSRPASFSPTENPDGIVYPLSAEYAGHVVTRAGENFGTNWENFSQVTLASGKTVDLPWSRNSVVPCAVPDVLASDILKQDGWRIIAHTMFVTTNPGMNYIFFYNKYSGVLKAFCYIETTNTGTNTAIWELSMDRPQTLFDFGDKFATAVNSRVKNSRVNISNIVTSTTKGFAAGWNCFQLELAYDPNFSGGYLHVDPLSMNQSTIQLTGSYQSKSEGLIGSAVNRTKGDSFTNGAVQSVGKEAKNWFEKQLAGDKFKKVTTPLLTEGVKSIVKLGLNKLVGGFLAIFGGSKPDEQGLQFTTLGSITLSGTITTPSIGQVFPIRIDLSPSKVGRLGVWSLKETPAIWMDPLGQHDSNATGDSYVGGTYLFRGYGGINYEIYFNPDLKAEAKNEGTTASLVRYSSFPAGFDSKGYDFGSIGGGQLTGKLKDADLVYKDTQDPIALYNECLNFSFVVRYVQPSTQVHPRIFLPFTRDAQYNPVKIKADHICVLSHSFEVAVAGQTRTVVSTKSFVPRLEWHPTWYNGYKDNFPY